MSSKQPRDKTDEYPAITPEEPGWTERGQQRRGSDFNTAMVHLFRAEVTRANVWRQRLDATTNWAVITTAAVISFVFGESTAHHSIIILNTLLVTLFLYIEARRYRYYELWSLRVRLIEINYFAVMLSPSIQAPTHNWSQKLKSSLLYPRFPISIWEALGRRLRRNYLWLYVLLGLAWLLRVWLLPDAADSWQAFLDRAAIGALPGWFVLLVGLTVNGTLFVIAVTTRHLHAATGEVLPHGVNLIDRDVDV